MILPNVTQIYQNPTGNNGDKKSDKGLYDIYTLDLRINGKYILIQISDTDIYSDMDMDLLKPFISPAVVCM